MLLAEGQCRVVVCFSKRAIEANVEVAGSDAIGMVSMVVIMMATMVSKKSSPDLGQTKPKAFLNSSRRWRRIRPPLAKLTMKLPSPYLTNEADVAGLSHDDSKIASHRKDEKGGQRPAPFIYLFQLVWEVGKIAISWEQLGNKSL
jgi:hypothetical protein